MAIKIFYQQVRYLRFFQEKLVRAMYWRSRSFDRVQGLEHAERRKIEWNYRSEIFAFSRRLQEDLKEDTLRRIFLPDKQLVADGDLLISDCIKPYLRHKFDRIPEDGILGIHSYLKSNEVLADVAKWIGCKDILDRPDETTMADTVKALASGIETDFNIDRARRFIVDIIISYLNDKDILEDVWLIPNPKETLNLILSNSSLPPYEPRIVFQTGIRTLEPCHLIGLYVNKEQIGVSAGETIEIAEQCAALDALGRLFRLKNDTPYVYGDIDYSLNMKPRPTILEYKI